MSAKKLIISGSGGQGQMFIGKMLSKLALDSYAHITFFPSYGAEVRGGTSNCQITLDSDPIASPTFEVPNQLILMNQPSVERFMPLLEKGGLAFVNTSLAHAEGPNIVGIPATDLAVEVGDVRVANVVMFGAFVQHTNIIDLETARNGVISASKAKGEKAVELNTLAFDKGVEYMKNLK